MAAGDRTVVVDRDSNQGAIWVVVVLAIAVIVGAVWYFGFANAQPGTNPATNITHNTTINVPAGQAGSSGSGSGTSGGSGSSGGDSSGSGSSSGSGGAGH